jgi:hypothetical protein
MRSFQAFYSFIGIQSYNEDVREVGRFCEVIDVPEVDQVEAPVRECDTLADELPPVNLLQQFIEAVDFIADDFDVMHSNPI